MLRKLCTNINHYDKINSISHGVKIGMPNFVFYDKDIIKRQLEYLFFKYSNSSNYYPTLLEIAPPSLSLPRFSLLHGFSLSKMEGTKIHDWVDVVIVIDSLPSEIRESLSTFQKDLFQKILTELDDYEATLDITYIKHKVYSLDDKEKVDKIRSLVEEATTGYSLGPDLENALWLLFELSWDRLKSIGSERLICDQEIANSQIMPIANWVRTNLQTTYSIPLQQKFIEKSLDVLTHKISSNEYNCFLLEAYVFKRQEESDNQFLHGYGRLFGFSKNEKFSAAQALINTLKNPDKPFLTQEHLKALKQGTLGQLVSALNINLESLPLKNSASPGI